MFYCNRRHETAHCWNLYGKPINQVSTNNRPWVNNPNKWPFTRPNMGPPYQLNDGRPRWNDTYNGPPVWNGPPTNYRMEWPIGMEWCTGNGPPGMIHREWPTSMEWSTGME
jgi:hypothetical protein